MLALLARIAPLLLQVFSGISGTTIIAPVPVMHSEQIALTTCPQVPSVPCTALPPGTTTSYTYTLQSSTVLPAMGAVVYFQSSEVGGDVFMTIPTVQSSIAFTLPAYSFTATDIITVVYWAAK